MTIWEILLTFSDSSISSVGWEGSEGKHWESKPIRRSTGVKVVAIGECVLVRVGGRVVRALAGVGEAVMLDIVA